MNIDRVAQFKPLEDLLPKMLTARQTSDSAENAFASQQTKVNGIAAQLHVLESRIQPYGGATPADYINYGTLSQQYTAELATMAALDAANRSAYQDFAGLWTQAKPLFAALLDNPGAVEQV